MISTNRCLLALSVVLLLASCGVQPANEQDLKAKSQNDVTLPSNGISNNLALLAAAEEFETLTEISFSANPSMREKMIAKAGKAAAGVMKFAPPRLTVHLQTHIADILSAQRKNSSADLAIASNEAFRDLVSAVAGKQQTPLNVSLLDYAGFRFDADAQALPARFADMQETAVFGQEQWAGIKSRPEVAGLSARFSAALDNMELASRSGDVALARTTAKVELDMVDELEKAFGQ